MDHLDGKNESLVSPASLHRRELLKSALAGGATILLSPGLSLGESRGARKVVAEVRKQLTAKSTLKSRQVNYVVGRVQKLLPQLGDISHGHVVIGIGQTSGSSLGVVACDDGHACLGLSGDDGPTHCRTEACDTHACEGHVCENQSCGTEACGGHACDIHEDKVITAAMKANKRGMSAWQQVRTEVERLKQAGQLKVSVKLQ